MNCRVYCTMMICALALATGRAAHGVTVTPPTDDSFGYQFLPTMNLNAPTPGFGAVLPVGKTATGHDTKSVIQFDISGVGLTGPQVASATLDLSVIDTTTTGFGANPSPGSPITVDLFPLLSSFDETTVNWNTIPSAGPLETSLVISGFNQTVSFDVTDLVKDLLDASASDFSVLLEANAAVGGSPSWVYAVFASNTAGGPGTSGQPGVLTITEVPEPSSVLLALCAVPAAALAWRRRNRRRA